MLSLCRKGQIMCLMLIAFQGKCIQFMAIVHTYTVISATYMFICNSVTHAHKPTYIFLCIFYWFGIIDIEPTYLEVGMLPF